eukprot:8505923-Alexandrium_andersonii.AAC.1
MAESVMLWKGVAWLGMADHGMAWALNGETFPGVARHGAAWLGMRCHRALLICQSHIAFQSIKQNGLATTTGKP